MNRFYTTLLSLVAISSIFTPRDTLSMKSTIREQIPTHDDQTLPYALPKEIWYFIVFLALEDELDKFRCSSLLQGHTQDITSVAWSPDSKTALTGSYDATARLWDIKTGKQLQKFSGHTKGITSVAWSPDGKIALTCSNDTTARLWDVSTGQQLHLFQGHTGYVTSGACSPNGKTVLTGSIDGTARLWDVSSGQQLHIFRGPQHHISSVAFNPDGKTVLTGSWDNTARLWDVDTEQQLYILEGHTDYIQAVGFSPDGKTVLTGSDDKTARLWDAATRQQLQILLPLPPEAISLIRFSADGKTVLIRSHDTAYLYDILTGQRLHILQGYTWVIAFACSPDGKVVLTTTSNDKTADLWKPRTWNRETKKLFIKYYPLLRAPHEEHNARELKEEMYLEHSFFNSCNIQ
ncbi:WD40 repeat domain-containing protein [Candidatus Dependentiae bacterium]|nr:WD40 repeat domain-containing protein [Candidatus Dependentiae bacterium]